RPQIRSRPAALQVPEQRQKDLLDNLLGIVHRQAERHYVAQQPLAKFVEQHHHFLLQGGVRPRRDRSRREKGGNRAVGSQALTSIFLHGPLCSKKNAFLTLSDKNLP